MRIDALPATAPSTLWRHANFLKLWAGQTVSLFGSRVTVLALPLTAVTVLHASAGQMGLLGAAQAAPPFLFGLLAGVWVDRNRRRPLMIAVDIGRALVLLIVPLAAALGVLQLWLLYPVAAAVAGLTLTFDVAYSSFLPSVLTRGQLLEGYSKLQMSESVAQVAGPGLGGALVSAFTAPIALVFDAVTFLVSASSLSWMSVTEDHPRREHLSIRSDIGDGLRVVFGDRVLRALLLGAGTFNLFDNALMAIYVLYMVDTLHLSAGLVGLVLGLGGIGGLAGAGVLGTLTRQFGLGRVLMLGITCAALSELTIGAAGGPVLLAFAILVGAETGVEFGSTIFGISSATLRQAKVEPLLLGRTGATMRTINAAVALVGALAGGVAAEAVGVRQVIIAAGLGTALSLAWIVASPVRQVRAVESGSPDGINR